MTLQFIWTTNLSHLHAFTKMSDPIFPGQQCQVAYIVTFRTDLRHNHLADAFTHVFVEIVSHTELGLDFSTMATEKQMDGEMDAQNSHYWVAAVRNTSWVNLF